MASRPYFDGRRGNWVMKYKREPGGPWLRVVLCKHQGSWSRSSPSKKPPWEAVERAREFEQIEYRARHGLETAPPRVKPLAAFLLAYADSQGLSARASSNRLLRRHIRSFLGFAEGQGVKSVQGVTRAHCRAYMEQRLGAVRHSTLETERGYLMGAWTRAVEDGLLAANPWAGVAAPGKAVETSITFWTSDEVGRIAGACTKPWHADLVLVLANTGLRISTALAMRWDWLDWGPGTIKIPEGVEDVKTAYALAMGRVAREVLSRRLATSKGSGLVFPNPRDGRGVVGYDAAATAIGRAIERAGVRPGTPHDFRHTYGRALCLACVPITVVQRQLGHKTLAMTMRYASIGLEDSTRFVSDFALGD